MWYRHLKGNYFDVGDRSENLDPSSVQRSNHLLYCTPMPVRSTTTLSPSVVLAGGTCRFTLVLPFRYPVGDLLSCISSVSPESSGVGIPDFGAGRILNTISPIAQELLDALYTLRYTEKDSFNTVSLTGIRPLGCGRWQLGNCRYGALIILLSTSYNAA